jgi:hypothetical protein
MTGSPNSATPPSGGDLRQRLQRLGAGKGRRERPDAPAPSGGGSPKRGPLESFVQGEVFETPYGPGFLITETLDPAARHGGVPFSAWTGLQPETLAHLADAPALADTPPEKLVFIDTETTGLGGGALAFEVGVGLFEGDRFVIRQFFLRNPGEEGAMLHRLREIIPPDSGLVTFNGRSFDVPLLSGRLILNRQPGFLEGLPHLDLLPPARRMWKRRLASCALGALEKDILKLGRSGADVPGSLIPWLYQQYLQTGDAAEMVRVLYHNLEDIRSMVALGVILAGHFADPDQPGLEIDDRISLARWYERKGMTDRAERAYRRALEEAPDENARYDSLTGLGYLFKRLERRAESLPLWESLADLRLDVSGHVELAKHYEWHEVDLERALVWTEGGIRLASSWRPGFHRAETLRHLNHRRERLRRKLNGETGGDDQEEELSA